jgi:hypothetical protein
MKRNELKKVLKPLIKECIKEVMFEDGTLSGIISEVVRGINTKPITAAPASKPVVTNNSQEKRQQISEKSEKINEARTAMLDAIGKDAYNGVNVFEGTTPMRSAGGSSATPQSPLANVDPGDPGIDISGIMELSRNKWKDLL